MRRISSTWFYSNPHPLFRLLTIYIKGDMLVILPIIIVIGLLGFISVRFMMLMLGTFYAIRGIGEMVYWLFQQFSATDYRPYDFGLRKIDNNAVYIVYQLANLGITLLGIGVFLWAWIYM